ncbi:MAG: PadR family transcriptional regulator [Candidatus Gastranaerophilaceae bacterium]
MIEICILYCLTKREMTIYSVRKRIEEYFGAFTMPSHGTIHPALKRFEEEKFVTVRETISDGGKKSSYYGITEKGKKHLCKLLLSELSENPSVSINEIYIRLSASGILSEEQKKELKQLCERYLDLYITAIERKINDQYSGLDNFQKQVMAKISSNQKEFISFIKTLGD